MSFCTEQPVPPDNLTAMVEDHSGDATFVTGQGSPLILRCRRRSGAAEGCDRMDSAERDTKELVLSQPGREVEEMRFDWRDEGGDSGIDGVWRVRSSQGGGD